MSMIPLLPACPYRVGDVYVTFNTDDPKDVWPGTAWTRLTGTFLYAGSGTPGQTGGSASVTLTTANLPAHTHVFTPSGTVSSTFKGSAVSTGSAGAHGHAMNIHTSINENRGYGLTRTAGFIDRVMVGGNNSGNYSTSSAGAHTHSVTAAGTVSSSFTGKAGTTGSAGSGTAVDKMPPYTVVRMWRRTA